MFVLLLFSWADRVRLRRLCLCASGVRNSILRILQLAFEKMSIRSSFDRWCSCWASFRYLFLLVCSTCLPPIAILLLARRLVMCDFSCVFGVA